MTPFPNSRDAPANYTMWATLDARLPRWQQGQSSRPHDDIDADAPLSYTLTTADPMEASILLRPSACGRGDGNGCGTVVGSLSLCVDDI
jgi:hypothetical protein